MGILIAIDGVDASGKQTQTELLKKRLENNELKIKSVSFPAYDNPSSTLVKMYLNGEFGDKPSDVNAYATSTFFAADRFATYKTDWGKDYENGTLILADRYVSSNLIHQASKIENQEENNKINLNKKMIVVIALIFIVLIVIIKFFTKKKSAKHKK